MATTTNAGRIYVQKDAPTSFADLPPLPVIEENIRPGRKIWIREMQSHQVAIIRNCVDSHFAIEYNQRLREVYMINCKNCQLQVLDSAVIVSQTCTFINCESCEFIFEDVDVRQVQCYGVTNSKVILISSPPLTELTRIHWREGCKDNRMKLALLLDQRLLFGIPFKVISTVKLPDSEEGKQVVSYVDSGEEIQFRTINDSFEPSTKYLKDIEEMEKLKPYPFEAGDLAEAYDQEKKEYEDSPDEIRTKARQIIEILRKAKHVVAYTGAGISTSANIPDFRGPDGVWTNKEKGRASKFQDMDVARPTYAHYALTQLIRKSLVKFLVTSNVDSLHLRTGMPAHLVVEHHGNIYKEVCESCGKSYYRQYIVASIGQHITGAHCTWCNGRLRDTHVAFGENVGEHDKAISLFNARKADVSFIMGTSMNVQPSVAFQLLPKKKNGKVILVNLQKTPYDHCIDVRVFAKTDNFMRIFMEELGEQEFDRETDLLSYWDTKKQLEEEQEKLKKLGPIVMSAQEHARRRPQFSFPVRWEFAAAAVGGAVLGWAIWQASFVFPWPLKR